MRSALRLGVMVAVLLVPQELGAQSESGTVIDSCGCTSTPVIPAGALDDPRVGGVVFGSPVVLEGSPRKKGEGVHGEQEHPYPWLRTLFLAEKSWGQKARWLLVERPWGRCGSVLFPGRRYLLTLPKEADPAATQMGALKAVTVAGCQVVEETDDASAATLLLGEPTSELDLREVVRSELGQKIGEMTSARKWCFTNDEVRAADSLPMTPGEWAEFAVPAAGAGVKWFVGQNGTSADGLDEVVLSVENPSACWLRVDRQVLRRWAVDGSAWRLLNGSSGLTVEDGWVPPYWQGTVRLARKLPWIRSVRLDVERVASPRIGMRGSRIVPAGRPTFRILQLDPQPGAHLDAGVTVRARLRWEEFPEAPAEGERWRFAVVFEAKDGELLVAPDPPAFGTLTPETPEGVVETRLTKEYLGRLREPMQMRFVVQRSAAGQGEGEMVDALQPVTYLRGIEPAREPVPAPKKGVWYTGGRGLSCGEAIVIRGVGSVQEGIAAERSWWRTEYPGSKLVGQGVSPPVEEGGKAFDHIELQQSDGEKLTLCFDITEFWGAPVRPGAPR